MLGDRSTGLEAVASGLARPAPGPSDGPLPGPVRAWLELCRAGNLSTILSNALVGWAIGTAVAPDRSFAAAAMAVALLYAAGMIFNDVCDARIDARERPRRPIPSGRVDLRIATIAVAALMAAALILLATTRQAAVGAGGVLVALIVAYDLLHARSGLAVLLMAACRAMVYVVVAAAAPLPGGWPLPLSATIALACTLGLYVAGLSLVARLEMDAPKRRAPAFWRRAAPLSLAALPFVALAAVRPGSTVGWLWSALAAVAMVLWILRGSRHAMASPPRRGRAVAAWLAAIPLVDAFFLALLDRPWMALVAACCWPLAVLAQRWLAAT